VKNLVLFVMALSPVQLLCKLNFSGCVLAQAVNRRLSTEPARVQARVRSCGICGWQSGTGAGFLRLLRLSLASIPLIAPHSSSFFTRGWYSRPVVASIIVDSAPRHPKKEKNWNVYISYSSIICWGMLWCVCGSTTIHTTLHSYDL
jgi:hypothetical protein